MRARVQQDRRDARERGLARRKHAQLALDDVLELTDVSRPVEVEPHRHRRRRRRDAGLPHPHGAGHREAHEDHDMMFGWCINET